VSASVGAARDPRFLPVTEDEVPTLSIDVSVLGAVVPLDDPTAFRPGIDGCIVERGSRRGQLLPQVATENGWGAREMLEAHLREGRPARGRVARPGHPHQRLPDDASQRDGLDRLMPPSCDREGACPWRSP